MPYPRALSGESDPKPYRHSPTSARKPPTGLRGTRAPRILREPICGRKMTAAAHARTQETQCYPSLLGPTRVRRQPMNAMVYLPKPKRSAAIATAFFESSRSAGTHIHIACEPALDIGDGNEQSRALAWMRIFHSIQHIGHVGRDRVVARCTLVRCFRGFRIRRNLRMRSRRAYRLNQAEYVCGETARGGHPRGVARESRGVKTKQELVRSVALFSRGKLSTSLISTKSLTNQGKREYRFQRGPNETEGRSRTERVPSKA